MKTKKNALGRGLSAILESPETDITSRDISGDYVVGAIANIPLDKIEANPFQPRNKFEEQSLNELATSIKEQGIIQPITVRKMGYEQYQLISGERRYRAAKKAGLKTLPAFIRVANDSQMLEMALIENIHREDLNALDVAISYQRLIEECNITTDELSDRIGKDRSTVANYVRLLKLPPQIQLAVRDNKISMGHARALINLENVENQIKILGQILSKGLSVRQVEAIVKESGNIKKKDNKTSEKPELITKHATIRQSLSSTFGVDVEIKANTKGKGKIVIPFDSESDFERIVQLLKK